MRRVTLSIFGLFLIYLCQGFIVHVYPGAPGILTGFVARPSLAIEPDGDSGDNVAPKGATVIKQTTDARWVIYDRGDQTDWLTVSPPKETTNHQLIIRINFLQVTGQAIVETYGADPFGDILERTEIDDAGVYEYSTSSIRRHYIKLYAANPGSQAHYEYSYALVASLSSTSPSLPTISPSPTAPPTIVATLPPPLPETPAPFPTPTAAPTVTPTITPTLPPAMPTPTVTMTPTAIPIPEASIVLSEAVFQRIAEKYGVPANLLLAISMIESQNNREFGYHDVSKVVDPEQLKVLEKIARFTNRTIADFKGSSSGAMGYMQLMPTTFYHYAQDGNGDGVKDPLNPYDSVATAAYFLAHEIAKHDSVPDALKSYHDKPDTYAKILELYYQLESQP